MIKHIFTTLFSLTIILASAQSPDQDKIIDLLYPEYLNDISETGYTAYFDEEQQMQISSVYVYPFKNDSSEFIAEMNWESEEYSWGNMTEYYILNFHDSNYAVAARTHDDNVRLYYGGGTQMYNDPQVMHAQLNLSDTIKGFAIRQASYHFASQSNGEDIYIFAVLNGKIKLVLETNLYSGFLSFSLKEMTDNNDAFKDLLQNPGDYMISDYMQEGINESFMNFELLKTKTSGMYDILFHQELYQITDDKISISKNKYLYKWDFGSYELIKE